jgi:hypothetical protein
MRERERERERRCDEEEEEAWVHKKREAHIKFLVDILI